MASSGDAHDNLSADANGRDHEHFERSDAEDDEPTAPPNNNRGRGGRDGIIPPNNMAIVAPHHLMDVLLFEKNVVCDAEALSAQDQGIVERQPAYDGKRRHGCPL